MFPRIAIIGTGPTGLYTFKQLIGSTVPLSITLYEAEGEPGKGTPYHPDMNDPAMLSNIPSIELPAFTETTEGSKRQDSNAVAVRQADACLIRRTRLARRTGSHRGSRPGRDRRSRAPGPGGCDLRVRLGGWHATIGGRGGRVSGVGR